MLASRRVDNHPADRRTPTYGLSPQITLSHVYSTPVTSPPPLDAFAVAVRSVAKALNSGALSEQQANDLFKVLATAYAGELISQRVGSYLESGLSHVLGRYIEEGSTPAGRLRP